MLRIFTRSKSAFIPVLFFITIFFCLANVSAQTTNYSYTGSMQTYVVPTGVFFIKISANGAQGANAIDRLTTNSTGGAGSHAEGVLAVTPGQTLNIYVGGEGSTNGTAAFNGGAAGGSTTAGASCSAGFAGGGGGATDVRVGGTALSNRVIVAAGGGGAGSDYCNGTCQPCGCGGSGGGGDQDGVAAGACGFNYPGSGVNFGSKATTTAGGAGGPFDPSGISSTGNNGIAGALGLGGVGANNTYGVAGGGGGGGYYGGGGGGGTGHGGGVGGGGGAGGSSYVTGLSNATITPAANTGNGSVTITVLTPVTITSQPLNSAVCLGNSTSFTVATNATGFQWQQLVGATWTNLANTGIYSGVTTATLAVTNPTIADHRKQYRCVLTSTSLAPDTTNSVMLSVTAIPTITGTTPGITCVGANGSVSATPSTGAEVQWYDQATMGSLLGTGNTLNITGATATKTYYADAKTFENLSGGLAAGNANIGMFFDVVAKNNISITDITWRAYVIGTYNVQVYIRPGTAIGFEASSTGWTLVGSVSGLAMTATASHKLSLTAPYALTNGQRYGIHIVESPSSNQGIVYSNGTGVGNLWRENTDLQMYVGNGSTAGLFGGVTNPNRIFDGLIGYSSAVCSAVARTPVVLTVDTAAVITAHPPVRAICTGGNTTFTVTATGSNLGYQWEVYNGTTWSNATGGIYTGGTTNTLTLTGATAAENGYQYRCVVSNTGCTPATSNAATLNVNIAPAITAHPPVRTICAGGNTTFTVTATGSNLNYQWEVYNGTTWSNATGGIYTGGTTNTLTLTGAAGTVDGYQYRCVVSNTGCTPATSNAGTLTVNTAPSVTTQPSTHTKCVGDNTSFSIIAAGTNLNYQWEVYNGTTWSNATGGIYTGGTTNTLILTGVTAAENGYQYRCIVSNTGCTPATSNAATLNVNTAPAITAHSPVRAICTGGNTTFTVTATGSNLNYQWEVYNGATWSNATGGIYTGATTNTLTLTGATTAVDGYQYRCLVSNTACTSATSNAGTLTVNAVPSVTSHPATHTICEGNTTFSVVATGTNLVYQWEVYNGTAWINATGGIYTGGTTNTLTLTGATAAVNGYQYRCVVSNTGCTPATSNAATLNVNIAPAVTAQPANSAICTGSNTTFTVTATGTNLNYQWEVYNGTTWSNATGGIYTGGTTNALTLTGATATVNGYQYRCVVSNTGCAPATSNAGTLTINEPPAVVADPASTTICAGSNTTFGVTATGTNLAYQWQVYNGTSWSNATGGIYTGGTTNTLTLTSATAAQNGYQYRCVVSNTGCTSATSNAATLNVNITPVVTAHPPSHIICAGNNTTFSITATGTNLMYQWEGSNNGTNWNTLYNNSTYSGVTASTLNITNALPPTTYRQYRCVVSNTGCTPAISNIGTFIVNTSPEITTQPINRSICKDQSTHLVSSAVGTAVTYQWQVSTDGGVVWNNVSNGGVYAGATTTQLVLTTLPLSMNGYKYRSVASGTCPAPDTSDAITLTVNTPVAITSNPTATTTICSGGNASLSVGATGSGLTYKWHVNTGSGWSVVSNGGVYSGATTSTLTITGITAIGAMEINNYFCEVIGICNTKASQLAELRIHALPTITTQPANTSRCDNSINLSFKTIATGTNLSYQWQENTGSGWTNITNGGNYSGATTNELMLSTITLSMNNYRYRCILTGTCGSAAVTTSNPATLTVNPKVQTSVAIASSTGSGDICAGVTTVFTATPTNGGSTPTYQWKRNNVNVATGSTYSTTTLAHNDVVVCHMISSIACPLPQAEVVSNSIKVNLIPVTTTTLVINSDYGTSGCSGNPIEFTATATNQGLTPTYKWFVNGTEIPGEVLSKYSVILNHNDQVKCEMTSSKKCALPNPITSNTMKMTINPTTKSSIVISPNPDSVVCEKQNVTMFVAFTNGGTTPRYQWMLNGVDMPGETNATLQTTGLQQGDSINCRLISSATCVYPEVSNGVTFDINPLLDPSVQLNIMYDGDNTYTFTATPTNGGANPTYVWYSNFKMLANLSGPVQIFTDLAKSDRIYVELVSDEECIKPELSVVASRIVTTGIGEVDNTANNLVLHPNPNNGRFTISGDYSVKIAPEVMLNITNSLGQLIYKEEALLRTGKLQHEVLLPYDLAPGIYTLHIFAGGHTDIRRFSIVK